MTDLTKIDPLLVRQTRTCRIVVETPKGSRFKYTYAPNIGALELSGLLPAGMSFPLDFGFVPGTQAEDGDPLDILVLGDEPAVAGCMVQVKLLGVIEAEQTEEGKTVRNDRLIARTALSINYSDADTVEDLGGAFIDHVGMFFVNYNDLKGKSFEILGVQGPDRAVELVERARADSVRSLEPQGPGRLAATTDPAFSA